MATTTRDDELINKYGGLVMVIEGRKRYHVEGCPVVDGMDVEEGDVRDIREEGFQSCPRCRPDEVLVATIRGDLRERRARRAATTSVPAAPVAAPIATTASTIPTPRHENGSHVTQPYQPPSGRPAWGGQQPPHWNGPQAPAKKPIWKRWWFIALGLFLIIGIATSAGGSKNDQTTTAGGDQAAAASTATAPTAPTQAPSAAAPATKAPVAPPVAQAPASTAPAAPSKPTDKGWVLESITVKKDALGQFSATARITNTNSSEKTAVFTVSLFKGGQQLTSLQGSVQQGAAGKTQTVDLISMDDYVAGPYTTDFQTDVSY